MTQTNRLNIAEPGGFWFFAYGSLMWDPPFPPADSQPARIYGYHRSFCVSSENYRGTPEKPGLSLGLDQGGSCTGVALYIDDASREHAIREIEAREMIHDPIYICRRSGCSCRMRPSRDIRLWSTARSGYSPGGWISRRRRDASHRAPGSAARISTILPIPWRGSTTMNISEGHLHHLLRRATQLRGGS